MEKLARIQPPVFPVGKISIPEASVYSLNNRVPVYTIEAGTEEVLRIEFTFAAGHIKDNMPLLASTTNMMLSEGSENYTSEKLHSELEFYGAFLQPTVDKDRAGIIVFCLSRHIAKILELCHEIIFRPVFPETELSTLMKKRLQWYLINREKVQNLSIDYFFESIFGNDHPYGYQPSNDDFRNILSPVLREFHKKYYRPGNMAIITSGKIPEGAMKLLNDYFGSIPEPEPFKETINILRNSTPSKINIAKPGTVQTGIRIGSRTINKRHPDYPSLKVLDSILGGYFGSRLMRNLREEKGYTYGIRSGVTSLDLSGFKMISTEVGNKYKKNALEEIYSEISILQKEPVGMDELEIVRNYMAGELLRMFDGPFALAESFKSAWEFGLDNSYFYRFAEKIKTIDPDEIMYLANKYYSIDELYEVTVGSED